MTQEWLLKTLIDLGFSKNEAEVYLLLYKEGPKKAKDIAQALRVYKRKVYRTLKNLQQTNIVLSTSLVPATFSAVSFDLVLDQFTKANLEQANRLEKNKEKIVALWKSGI